MATTVDIYKDNANEWRWRVTVDAVKGWTP